MTSCVDPAAHRGSPGTLASRGRGHAVVLITADWCAPARPAPTVLRELSARWGEALETFHIRNPDDDVLTALGVTSLPTWLLLRIGDSSPGSGTTAATALPSGSPSAAEPTPWNGAERGDARPAQPRTPESAPGWAAALRRLMEEGAVEVHRRTGAHPKHVIDDEFGPSTGAARSQHD